MADNRFFIKSSPLKISEIAKLTGVEIIGNEDFIVSDVAPLDKATAEDISFLDNVKYVDSFIKSKAAVCFIREKYVDLAPKNMILLVGENPYSSYAIIAQKFYSNKNMGDIHSSAYIGKNTSIADGVTIKANVTIGDGVKIGKNSYIGANSVISHSYIGENTIIHNSANIGQDGFGFSLGAKHIKVPQLGCVMIGDDVEIGAGTCIDRGAGSDTIIGNGTKIDNLVQIGHNVQIGKYVIIVAQVGIAGSTKIGDYTMIGGQVGIAGHINIGSNVKIAAQSGVHNNIKDGESYGGSPAVPTKEWYNQIIAIKKLIRKKNGKR